MDTTDTAIQSEARTIAIDRLHVPNNVRALDQAHVDALAGPPDSPTSLSQSPTLTATSRG